MDNSETKAETNLNKTADEKKNRTTQAESDISDLEKKIIRQVEYDFGDVNLMSNSFVKRLSKLDDGWVNLDEMIQLTRLGTLSKEAEVILTAIRKSTSRLIEISEDKTKIRRSSTVPLPERKEDFMRELTSKTVYCEGFPLDSKYDELFGFFTENEHVIDVQMRKLKKVEEGIPSWHFKGSVCITFKTVDAGEKFLKLESVKYKDVELTRMWWKDYCKLERIQERSISLRNKSGGGAGDSKNAKEEEEAVDERNFVYQLDKLQLEGKSSFSTPHSSSEDKPPDVLAVHGVYFKCPFIGPDILPKGEWKERIRAHLYEQLEVDKGFTSCLMIHTLNKNREKVQQCVDKLCTYLKNLIDHPDEDKYKKIRFSNKAFQERVVKIEGSLEFLAAAGFEKKMLQVNDAEEEFFVYSTDVDSSHLEMLIDSLHSAEPISIELDRNLSVLSSSEACSKLKLPDDFFNLKVKELKREQQLRSKSLESSMQLRTKAMREKDKQRELKKYQYTLIRVGFPDGLFLQGTFRVYEKLSAVRQFVKDNLNHDAAFELRTALGKNLGENEDEKTLLDLKLVPADVITFNWSASNAEHPTSFLKPEHMANVKTL